MKGDIVEVVVDTGGGFRSFEIEAARSGRRLEVTNARGIIEVAELTRTGKVVRTARFNTNRVIAMVEHPAEGGTRGARRRTR